MNHNRKVLYQSIFKVPVNRSADPATGEAGGSVENIVAASVVIAHSMAWAAFGYAATTGPLTFAESPPQFAKPFAAAQQQFQELAPFGYAATTGPMRFTQSPDLFAKPLFPAVQQRWPDFVPLGTIVTPQFIFSESQWQFAKPLAAAQQQFGQADVVISTVTTTPWVGEPLSVKFVPPLAAAQQRFPDFVPQGTIVSVTPQGGYYEGFPPQFAKPFPVSQQTLPGLAPFGFAATTGPLTFAQSPDQFWKPAYAVTLQRYPDFVPFGYAATTGPLTFQPSPERFAKPYPAQEQLFGSSFGYLAPSQFIAQTYVQLPELFRQPYNVALQRFPDFAPAGTITTAPPTLGLSQSPDIFAKPYPAQLQRWPDFTPRGTIVTPQFIFSESPWRFAVPFTVSLQRFQDFAPRGTIVTPQFIFSESPPQLGRQFQSALQKFFEYAPFGYAATTGPLVFSQAPHQFKAPVLAQQFATSFGYLAPSQFIAQTYVQLPEKFSIPFAAYLQQYSASYGFNPPPPVATATSVAFSESPPRLVAPYPAGLQRFSVFQPGSSLSPLGTGKRRPLLLENSGGTTFGGGPSYWPDGNG